MIHARPDSDTSFLFFFQRHEGITSNRWTRSRLPFSLPLVRKQEGKKGFLDDLDRGGGLSRRRRVK